MREILGLIVGLYLTVALVVLGGGVYGFATNQPSHLYDCTPGDLKVPTASGGGQLKGGPSWMPYVLIRAAIWPKSYWDDRNKASGVVDWLIVKYNPFPGNCRGAASAA